MEGKRLMHNYKHHLSNFLLWEQLLHAQDYILFPYNIGSRLSIDETSLHGELYTILTNKAKKGRKGALVAMIKGTKNEVVSSVLGKIPFKDRIKVKEVTADMAGTMDWIIRTNFMQATKIIDRFHVQKLVSEAVQEVRIQHRWLAINEENALMQTAKDAQKTYHALQFENGDTKKQLLARSRYILFTTKAQWSESQQHRAAILFREYPDIQKAYELSMMFRSFYEANTSAIAQQRLVQWYSKVDKYGTTFPAFVIAAQSIKHHECAILHYFTERSTNAAAESFNAKIKGFRSVLRGVNDMKFFMFRLAKLYG